MNVPEVDNFIGEVVTELEAALSDDAADSLATLHRLIVTFIEVQARRPELARLMNVESSIDGPRLRYLYDQFIAPWTTTADRLVDELVAAGRIRPLPPGTLYFLVAYGATGMAAHPPFAKLLGVANPTDPAVIHAHALAVADLVLTPPAPRPDRRAILIAPGACRQLLGAARFAPGQVTALWSVHADRG